MRSGKSQDRVHEILMLNEVLVRTHQGFTETYLVCNLRDILRPIRFIANRKMGIGIVKKMME